jgi:hypothetical protein
MKCLYQLAKKLMNIPVDKLFSTARYLLLDIQVARKFFISLYIPLHEENVFLLR